MGEKPKVAFYWCASCGGCEEAVIDLAEDILKVVEAVDIVFWPVALDFKKSDIEAMEDGSIAVSFINGAVRLSEQEEMVKLLRKKSQLVVAFGTCAHLGGIPGLANFWDKESIFNRAYHTTPSTDNPEGVVPQEKSTVDGKELYLPSFFNTVYALNQVIDVDYYLPGCAPPRDLIMNAVQAILEGNLPPKGSVLSPNKALCEDCDRNETKPEKLAIKDIKRPWEVILDPETCFLAQGVICMGPATRTGCGQRCITANMPCRGCFGPTDQVVDMGAKFLAAFASILDADDEKEVAKIVETIVDPAGTFYRFSLPTSILRRRKLEGK
ncbi:MAG: oxidoreductase [Candidatus Aminicenantes bacterium 4484_214]|nr:MAG: oxidoreductase [Candidatus Aminicenantes bacterium 4484_214]